MSRKILQISSYPPPHQGWAVRVQFLKHYLERQGHQCVVLNIGANRCVPSDEYETVLSGVDYLRKLWRYSRRGFVAHVHVNGASAKGFVLSILAEIVNLLAGRRCFLTFHAGIDQVYFPRPKYPLLLPVFWVLFAIPRWIICNSEEVKARIVKYGVNPNKVVPIPAFTCQYLERTEAPLPADLEAFYGRFDHVVFCYIKMRPLFYPEATVKAFAQLAARRPDVGLVLCGIEGHMESGLWPRVQECLTIPDLQGRFIVVNDLPHEVFLAALGRATIYLRTHLSDGVCSSVLEALTLGVPVVAVENHDRPPHVITYDAEKVDELAALLDDVLRRRQQIAAELRQPDVRDTLALEANLLTT